jgi:hypothetical protein
VRRPSAARANLSARLGHFGYGERARDRILL